MPFEETLIRGIVPVVSRLWSFCEKFPHPKRRLRKRVIRFVNKLVPYAHVAFDLGDGRGHDAFHLIRPRRRVFGQVKEFLKLRGLGPIRHRQTAYVVKASG